MGKKKGIVMRKQIVALKLALEALEHEAEVGNDDAYRKEREAIREALAQPSQETVGWKLVPIEPTDLMLKAMDECSTEGYDERLLAGHASSVYMAAVDVAPIPPEQNPKCGAIIEVFGKDWRLEYMSLPVGKHKLYTQQYTYNAPPQRKPLTDEEIADLWSAQIFHITDLKLAKDFVRDIEAAHNIKGEA